MECVLDTHPLVFLMYQPKSLGRKATKIISQESTQLYIPTMVILETQCLIEVGKIRGSISDFVHYIQQTPNMEITGFSEEILPTALLQVETRDPFDRIILSTALSRDIHIITRDRWMKNNYSKTIW